MGCVSKCIASIKVDGEVADELKNGTVTVPFGSEYSVFIKNKNDRRVVAQIFIDEENVSGAGYVVDPGKSIEIERNSNYPSKFKFVDLNSREAKREGKSGPNHDKGKGLVEVRFFFEKKEPEIVHRIPYKPIKPYRPYGPYYGKARPYAAGGQTTGHYQATNDVQVTCSYNINTVQNNSLVVEQTHGDLQDGCTVDGSHSNQTFGSTYVNIENTYTSVKLFLQGYKISRLTKKVNEDIKRQIAELEEALNELKSKV